jgi:hypothetical protein
MTLVFANVAAAEKIRPEHDIQYLGAFRVPTDSSSNYSWGWLSKNGLVFNPDSGNLISPPMYSESHANFGKITEFTIPAPVISATKNLSDLNVSSTVHDWTDITEGLWDVGYTSSKVVSDMAIIPAQGTQTSSKIYWLSTSWYSPSVGNRTLGMSDLNFTTPNAKGTWIIDGEWAGESDPETAKTSRYAFTIPQNWADNHVSGYSLGVGENKPNNGGSRGACLFAVKPWDTDTPLGDGEDIDSKMLMCAGMDTANRRNYDASHWDFFSFSDQQLSVAWVEVGSRSAVILSGSISYLPADTEGDCDPNTEICEYYKDNVPYDNDALITPVDISQTSPDACTAYPHDYRAEPTERVLWFYDPDDLAAVASGGDPWAPQPYATLNLEPYLWATERCLQDRIGGIAYDQTLNKLYVVELRTDTTVSSSDISPIIHVFQLSDSGLTADIVAPSQVTVNHDGTGNLSWSAAADDSGGVTYVVYRNGKPIRVTSETSYTDDVGYLFSGWPNHTYTIDAQDSVGNSVGRGQVEYGGAQSAFGIPRLGNWGGGIIKWPTN